MIEVDHQRGGKGGGGILTLRHSHQLTRAAAPQRSMRVVGRGEKKRKKGLDSRLRRNG